MTLGNSTYHYRWYPLTRLHEDRWRSPLPIPTDRWTRMRLTQKHTRTQWMPANHARQRARRSHVSYRTRAEFASSAHRRARAGTSRACRASGDSPVSSYSLAAATAQRVQTAGAKNWHSLKHEYCFSLKYKNFDMEIYWQATCHKYLNGIRGFEASLVQATGCSECYRYDVISSRWLCGQLQFLTT